MPTLEELQADILDVRIPLIQSVQTDRRNAGLKCAQLVRSHLRETTPSLTTPTAPDRLQEAPGHRADEDACKWATYQEVANWPALWDYTMQVDEVVGNQWCAHCCVRSADGLTLHKMTICIDADNIASTVGWEAFPWD